jgi:hypothetical protein
MNKFAELMGGQEIAVTHRDGTSEPVRVRALPIAEFPELLKVLDDELGQVQLYCEIRRPNTEGRKKAEIRNPKAESEIEAIDAEWMAAPAGWAATLMPDSHELVISTAEALNKDFFWRWMRRRMDKLELVRPGLAEKMFAGVGAAALGLGLPSSSPKSAPTAGSPGPKP